MASESAAPEAPESYRINEAEIRSELAGKITELVVETASLRSALRMMGAEKRALQEQIKDLQAELDTLRDEEAQP